MAADAFGLVDDDLMRGSLKDCADRTDFRTSIASAALPCEASALSQLCYSHLRCANVDVGQGPGRACRDAEHTGCAAPSEDNGRAPMFGGFPLSVRDGIKGNHDFVENPTVARQLGSSCVEEVEQRHRGKASSGASVEAYFAPIAERKESGFFEYTRGTGVRA